MAYRVRAQVQIDWVGPGAGPMQALNAPMLPGGGTSGQTLEVVSKQGGYVIQGTGTFTPPGGTAISGALAAADVTNLTNSLAADIAAQLNANIATPQGWVAGFP